MTPPFSRKREFTEILTLALISLVVGAAAITQQSLWMDEGGPAFKAMMPTLQEWWKITLWKGGSDVQMPIYMPALWAWEKLFGNSEFALRAMNLPFLVIMVIALRKVRFWPLVCLSSPFVLYYVGELRPYAMQLAGGACAAAAFAQVIDHRAKGLHGLHTLLASAMFLAASSLSAIVWSGGLVLGALVIRTDWLKDKRFWLHSLLWLPLGLALGAYYAFTIIEGYRGAPSGGGGLLSMFFGFYELAGMLGLGPSRNELRESPKALMSHLPWLLPALACLLAAWLFGLRQWLRSTPPRVIIGVVVAAVSPIILLAIVAVVADFRVLGRHMSPMIPVVLLPFCACLAVASGRRRSPQFIIGVLAILVSLTSAAFLRFDQRHARDDFRTTTAMIFDALEKHQNVLWKADISTPYYYALRKGGWPCVKMIEPLYPTFTPAAEHALADVIFINRPDLRYPNGDYREIMRQNDFKLEKAFPGFEVWKNQSSTHK